MSTSDNHMNLWRKIVHEHIDSSDAESVIAKGYKSIERGRVVFNIRTQSYEVICSQFLLHDNVFRNKCIDYFGLSGNRYSFDALNHYYRQELTGNPSLDSLYYEDGQF